MKKNIVKKGLAFAIIVLFIGVSFQPIIAKDALSSEKKSSILVSNGNILYVGGSGTGNSVGKERQMVLYDNGLPDGLHGFSCVFVEGSFNREICDDFYAYDSWSISGGQFRAITWDSYGPESIAGVNVSFYPDNSGSPSIEPIATYTVNCTGWFTGNYYYNRPEMVLNVTFGPLSLVNGTYWVVFQPIRLYPENVFLLSSPGMPGNELYFSYPDAGYPKWTPGHIIFSDFYYGYSFILTGTSDNEQPIANFTIINDSLCGVVVFDGSFSYDPDGTIISYEWDFGDGTIDNGIWAYHQYCGCDITYNVTLTVTDNEGLKGKSTKDVYIVYANLPPPYTEIYGPTSGKVGTIYDYKFRAMYPEDIIIFYFIDWGDGNNTGWIGPYDMWEIITINHSWLKKGNYIIKAKVKDFCREGYPTELTVTIPRNKGIYNSLFLRFLEQFLNAFPIIRYIFRGR